MRPKLVLPVSQSALAINLVPAPSTAPLRRATLHKSPRPPPRRGALFSGADTGVDETRRVTKLRSLTTPDSWCVKSLLLYDVTSDLMIRKVSLTAIGERDRVLHLTAASSNSSRPLLEIIKASGQIPYGRLNYAPNKGSMLMSDGCSEHSQRNAKTRKRRLAGERDSTRQPHGS
ncbi:unnamed protein product, partial [Iphiclides podalirius]